MLGPLQRGGHEEQEGPVHAVNGGEVTPAAGTEPCFGFGSQGGGEDWEYTHTLRWMNDGDGRGIYALVYCIGVFLSGLLHSV